jgi:hypothetical protein
MAAAMMAGTVRLEMAVQIPFVIKCIPNPRPDEKLSHPQDHASHGPPHWDIERHIVASGMSLQRGMANG